jgi:hypothetical protein
VQTSTPGVGLTGGRHLVVSSPVVSSAAPPALSMLAPEPNVWRYRAIHFEIARSWQAASFRQRAALLYGFDVFFGPVPALKLTVLLAGLVAYCGAWLAR